MLEAHAPLGPGQRGQPIGLDQHRRPRPQGDQAAKRDQGKQEEQSGGNGINPDSPVHVPCGIDGSARLRKGARGGRGLRAGLDRVVAQGVSGSMTDGAA